MKVLLVEDDQDLQFLLSKRLKQETYIVESVSTGAEALSFLYVYPVDLMLLDLNLPDMDGIQVCEEARTTCPNLLVLMLTARDKPQEVIRGLDAGADDYLTKPFHISVLLARIRALFRRDMQSHDPIIQIQDIRLDPAEKTVWKGGNRLNLTNKEFGVLEYLMRRPGQVISQEELLMHVWYTDNNVFTNSPRVHIKSIRNKLGDDANLPKYIETVIGSGYRFLKEKK